MNNLSITEEHKKFWAQKKTSRPLASFRIGNYFFATHYKAAERLLVKGKKITADMIDVDSFLEDYERQYLEICAIDQNAFWTAEPYTGIPWMEAFWGCEIIAGKESFSALPFIRDPGGLGKLEFRTDNPWVKKFFEFVVKLNKLSAGRFPIGAPILRGQGDTAGAILGQAEFIYALHEEPGLTGTVLGKIADSFLWIYSEMFRLYNPFLGGSSMGFYHIWTPGKSLWFQDDMGALLSPALYRDFFLENEKRICSQYDYTLIHLHPSAFHLLGDILENGNLKSIEINKDIGGPGIDKMLVRFRQVLDSGRNLVIWGDLTEDEIRLIFDKLETERIFLNIVLPDFDRAMRMNLFLKNYFSV